MGKYSNRFSDDSNIILDDRTHRLPQMVIDSIQVPYIFVFWKGLMLLNMHRHGENIDLVCTIEGTYQVHASLSLQILRLWNGRGPTDRNLCLCVYKFDFTLEMMDRKLLVPSNVRLPWNPDIEHGHKGTTCLLPTVAP